MTSESPFIVWSWTASDSFSLTICDAGIGHGGEIRGRRPSDVIKTHSKEHENVIRASFHDIVFASRRLKKIEANAEFIIATEAEKSDDEPSHLSVEEFEFAKNYLTELKVRKRRPDGFIRLFYEIPKEMSLNFTCLPTTLYFSSFPTPVAFDGHGAPELPEEHAGVEMALGDAAAGRRFSRVLPRQRGRGGRGARRWR